MDQQKQTNYYKTPLLLVVIFTDVFLRYFFSSFKFQASPKGLQIKKNEGSGEAWRMCKPHERFSGRVAYWVKVM